MTMMAHKARPMAKMGRLFPTPEEETKRTALQARWEAERARYKPGQKFPRNLRSFSAYAYEVNMGRGRRMRWKRRKIDAMGDSTFRRNRRLLGEIDAGKHDARLAREEAEWMLESDCGQDDTLWHKATIIPSSARLAESARFQALSLTSPRLWLHLTNRREKAINYTICLWAMRQMSLRQRVRLAWFDMASAERMGHAFPLWSYVIEALRIVAHDGADASSIWHLIPSWLREQLDRTRGLDGFGLPATMSDEVADAMENIDAMLDGLARREPSRRNPRGPHRHRTGSRLYMGHVPREMRNFEEVWDGDLAWWKKRAEACQTILAGGYPEP